MLEELKERVHYNCESPVTTEGSLHGKVFVQFRVRRMDHVEFTYYSMLVVESKHISTATADETMQDQVLLAKYKVLPPACTN